MALEELFGKLLIWIYLNDINFKIIPKPLCSDSKLEYYPIAYTVNDAHMDEIQTWAITKQVEECLTLSYTKQD